MRYSLGLFGSFVLLLILVLRCEKVESDRRTSAIQIQKITLASNDVEQMVKFYNEVLNCNLQSKKGLEFLLYEGELDGIIFQICPNEVAKVKASQNRQQFEFLVNDIEQVISLSERFGGSVKKRDEYVVSIIDPDGNTLVFTQNQN